MDLNTAPSACTELAAALNHDNLCAFTTATSCLLGTCLTEPVAVSNFLVVAAAAARYRQEIAISPMPLPSGPDALCEIYQDRTLLVSQKQLLRAYVAAQAYLKMCRRAPPIDLLQVLAASALVLLQSPDHNTALNARKACIKRDASLSDAEMRLVKLFMTVPSTSKSLQLWHYLRWLQDQAATAQIDRASELLSLALRSAQLYPRNYAAWSQIAQLPASPELVATIAGHIRSHLSDHSAVAVHAHHLYLIKDLDMWKASYTDALQRILDYPHYESPWLHVRLLGQVGLKLGCSVSFPSDQVSREQHEASHSCTRLPCKQESSGYTIAQQRLAQHQTARHLGESSLAFWQRFLES